MEWASRSGWSSARCGTGTRCHRHSGALTKLARGPYPASPSHTTTHIISRRVRLQKPDGKPPESELSAMFLRRAERRVMTQLEVYIRHCDVQSRQVREVAQRGWQGARKPVGHQVPACHITGVSAATYAVYVGQELTGLSRAHRWCHTSHQPRCTPPSKTASSWTLTTLARPWPCTKPPAPLVPAAALMRAQPRGSIVAHESDVK